MKEKISPTGVEQIKKYIEEHDSHNKADLIRYAVRNYVREEENAEITFSPEVVEKIKKALEEE
ncbi:MAG: hypothetical protein J7L08_03715 [Candidatus Aenigmarchaeota archaeon]|nr:hypothetical protein [Candidatus Aenigmarchaeota archaeon]